MTNDQYVAQLQVDLQHLRQVVYSWEKRIAEVERTVRCCEREVQSLERKMGEDSE